MIKNERQYRITKANAEKFARALKEAESRSDVDPLLKQLEHDAIRSQLEDLEHELHEYECLRSGQERVLTIDSFADFPRTLVKARIAAGLSQKDLADRLGLKEQQIQRYEATDYASASVARLKEVIDALGVRVREDIFLRSSQISSSFLFQRLDSVGLGKSFVVQRLLPPSIAEPFIATPHATSSIDVLRASAIIGRVYGWNAEDILSDSSLRLEASAAGMARFKLPLRTDQRYLSAYTIYAHFLATLVLKAFPQDKQTTVPTETEEFHRSLMDSFGEITFSSVLRYSWQLGIPVLPLQDSGAFHGACWRVQGRNIIVLKQRTQSQARWLHDLLHELYHAGQEPGELERSTLEEPEDSPVRRESEEEQQASAFAGEVSLHGRAEKLALACVNAAGGSVPRLKSAVQRIAIREGVDVGILANYMAFRLALQDINWWGAATNLQQPDNAPWETARDALLSFLDLKRLDSTDRDLLLHALTSEGG